MESYLYTIRNRVRTLRGDRRLSQSELGSALGVSRQTINAIEAGRHAPSLPLAMKIGRYFDLPVESIFFDDEPH
ncbi:helix-turn-helix transcriptional regulator [soil metagenome]